MNTPLSRRHAWLTSDGGRCNLRGVLKITLPKWQQSVSYHMAVENSTLLWGKEGGNKRRVGGMEGREGRREGWREGGREAEREGESKGREVGSDDARQAERVSG